MPYTVLGTGLMGSAVARALVDAGHEVTVWNRTSAKAAPLVKHGATVAQDLAAAIDTGDAIVLMLLDQDAALEALDGHMLGLKGKSLINMMTGTPAHAAEFEALVVEAGGRYLDGAIECYPSDIASHDAIINFSGDKYVWDEHGEALRRLAGRSAFVGVDPGAANVLDAALAGTFHSVALGAFVEAMSLLSSRGIDTSAPELALDYWLDFLKAEALQMVDIIARGDYATTEATLSVYLAAVRQWRETMVVSGERATLMTAHMHNLEIAEASGCGDLAFASQFTTASVRRN